MEMLHSSENRVILITANEIDQLSDVPGLYAWVLIPRFHRDVEPVFRTLSQSTLDVDITGNLYQKYSGKAWRNKQLVQTEPPALPMIQLFCTWAGAPIYIGQSERLKQRLTAHQDELRAILYSNFDDSESHPDSESVGSVESDTIEESATFARRIGHAMRQRGLRSIATMSIYIFTGQSFAEKATRLNAERWLNRAFAPVFGRN
jgi:hypothetical protein